MLAHRAQPTSSLTRQARPITSLSLNTRIERPSARLTITW